MNKLNVMKKIKADGRTVSGWARLRGHKVSTVQAIIDGRIGPHCYSYKIIVPELKEYGYLTDEDES